VTLVSISKKISSIMHGHWSIGHHRVYQEEANKENIHAYTQSHNIVQQTLYRKKT